VADKRTFLVLDDDDDTRHLTRVHLQRAFPGVVVLECTDTEAAISQAQGHDLDGVITDHHLGTSEGSSIIQRLRDAGVRCPVVMFTGSSDPSVYRRAYEAGAARVFAGSDTDYIGYFRAQFAD
jgi:DNA-binding NarL/FixJ family response regulator